MLDPSTPPLQKATKPLAKKSSRVIFIVLRFMRGPILVLMAVYAVSMAGWVLIPGVDLDGKPQHMSLFHAFYFLTYTATTTGFGELPYAYSEAQRMWAIVTLYVSVIAWFYAVGRIVQLVQNPYFQQAVAERRFASTVKRISEPFHIICGFGDTGSLLARGLSDVGKTAVIIDQDSERIKALSLRDYRVPMPGLWADARVPDHLIEAGLLKPNCKAVVALTRDEEVNLKIAVTARLLNPGVRVITQSTSEVYEETLCTLGGDLHVIDPFQIYARYLCATIANPAIHTLSQWLSGTPGADLTLIKDVPHGRWILCGLGRMGRRLREAFRAQGISTVAIEPEIGDPDDHSEGVVVGRANQATLEKAGIRDAVGLVAATNNDSDNLSILINARALNPKLFIVVRQNRHRNEIVFHAARADLIMQPTLVSARRILFLLTAPLLKTFFEHLRERDLSNEADAIGAVMDRLRQTIGGTRPRLWTVDVCDAATTTLLRVIASGTSVTLGDALRDPADRRRRLDCVPLVIQSGRDTVVLPAMSHALRPGDQVLFCGTNRAYRLLDATFNNEYTLRYLISGIDEPRGIVMQWAIRKFSRQAAAA